MTLLALSGAQELESHLRQRIDEAAKHGDWEEALAFAAAEESETLRLLLACRALVSEGVSLSEEDALQVRALLRRWSEVTKEDTWRGLMTSLTPTSR